MASQRAARKTSNCKIDGGGNYDYEGGGNRNYDSGDYEISGARYAHTLDISSVYAFTSFDVYIIVLIRLSFMC